MNDKKYYLGLDLGISSVGWAVMEEVNKKFNIHDFGVRLFDCAENPKDGQTNAEIRRIFRGSRRLIRRRKQRINDLKRFLTHHHIMNSNDIKYLFSAFKKGITNNLTYDETKYFNPYVIRVKGLTAKLTPQELTIALINIANHRGYNDKFSFQENENEDNKKQQTSKLDESINKAESLVKQYGTIAQVIIKDTAFKNKENNNTLGLIHNKNKKGEVSTNDKINNTTSNYRYLFARADYRKELTMILTTQAQFYPQLTPSNINILINDIILRQRDFEVGPGPKDEQQKAKWKKATKNHRLFQSFLATEGKCLFYPQLTRGYRCSLIFEIFQLVSALSTFTTTILNAKQTIKVASDILREIKTGDLLTKNKIKDELKRIMINSLDLDKKVFTNNKVWNNKELKFNFSYLKLLKSVLPEYVTTIDINNLSNHLFHDLGTILHENITPNRRKEALIKFFVKHNITLSELQLNSFLKLPKAVTSTANTSFKYMIEAINAFFNTGTAYGKFQADFNKMHEQEMFNFNSNHNQLFAPINDEDMRKNAVVFRAINQARKIIKALHYQYGFFQVINVELARDLAKTHAERKEIQDQNKNNYKKRIMMEEELKQLDIKPTSINITKYILWKQQAKKCIYCENHHEIPITELGKSNALQIDHIIPQKAIADDSKHNKVLVCNKANHEKGKQTPLQWLKNNDKQRISYLNFCESIKGNLSQQKYDYLMTKDLDSELLDDFATRNLNDTRYITRYVTNWLKQEFKQWTAKTGEFIPTTVQSINGIVTSRFRRIWLGTSAWGLAEKVRDITPYHHAVDAMILTQFTSTSYVTFASDIVNITNQKHALFKKLITQEQYKKNCEEILAKWERKDNKLNVPDSVKRLKQIIANEKTNFKIMAPLVKNLQTVIENRIPVELEKVYVSEEFDLKNNKNEETIILPQKVIKETPAPKFVRVLNQEEYQIKLVNLNLNGELHYPFISYKRDYKLAGPITSSQLPVNTRFEIKSEKTKKDEPKIKSQDKIKFKVKRSLFENNNDENNKLKDSYIQDQHGTFWEINTYYGVAIKFVNNKLISQWIRRIQATPAMLEAIKKDQVILVPRTIVEYFDKKLNKKVIKLFNGKMGSQILANLLGTVSIQNEKSAKTFGSPNYYDSISNWSKDFRIIEPNILGKVTD